MKKSAFRFTVALMAAIALSTPAGQQAALAATGPLCYVDIDATGGTNNGNSWTNAYTDLQSALTDSNCTEIWVAAGVYKPGTQQSQTFTINEGEKVYGGFAGTEVLLAQRNAVQNVTILSGDIDNNDINTDGNHINESATNIMGSNSYRVVNMDGISTPMGPETVLDGFVITGGDSVGSGSGGMGGGLYCGGYGAGKYCSPTLSALTFSGNRAGNGGALYNNGGNGGVSSPTLLFDLFQGNTATGSGGAVYNQGSPGTSSPSFTVVTFSENSAQMGGAVYNSASGSGTGISNPSFTWASFDHNTASISGGAVYNSAADGTSSPTFDAAAFTDNSAGVAGGGGAMRNDTSSGWCNPSLTNVTFHGNSTTSDGGAMLTSAGASGTSSPVLVNVTFSGNTANNKGGAMRNMGTTSAIVMPGLTNVIMWGDSAPTEAEVSNLDASPVYTNSIVQGSGGSSSWNSAFGVNMGGNLDANPLLAPIANDWTMALIWTSPAIDSGYATSCPLWDQRLFSRPRGNGCDMGAYERIPPRPRADFETDDVNDMTYFHAATGLWGILKSSTGFSYSSPQFLTWGQTGDIVVPGDFDGDLKTDPTVRRPPAGAQSAAYLILKSSTGYDYGSSLIVPAGWPGLGDTPVPADYNADGITDPAIWRGSSGVWIIPLSPNFNNYRFYAWGASGDTPVGADVDGDGQDDLGYWRPSTGVWGFLLSTQNYSYASPLFFNWGTNSDIPVMADYDGDGKADPAVVIPPAGGQSRAYRILLSTMAYAPGSSLTIPAGWPGLVDTPVPNDYDGDGKADAGIWRGSTGVWIIPKSSTNNTEYMFAQWGASGDQVAK